MSKFPPQENEITRSEVLHTTEKGEALSVKEGFKRYLEVTNYIRTDFESSESELLAIQSSADAYDRIWELHVGDTQESMARAYSEGGGAYTYSAEEWLDYFGKEEIPDVRYIREVEGLDPMLSILPEPPREELCEKFFGMVDRILQNPSEEIRGNNAYASYMTAARLQLFAGWLHPKLDANGRTSEDWALWYQYKLQQVEFDSQGDPSGSTFLSSLRTKRKVLDSSALKSWHNHGLRFQYGSTDDFEDREKVPPFLSEDFSDIYIHDRIIMRQATEIKNDFKREMFKAVSKVYNYRGAPAGLARAISDDPNKLVDMLSSYLDPNNFFSSEYVEDTHMGAITRFERLYWGLPDYKYQFIKPEDAILNED